MTSTDGSKEPEVIPPPRKKESEGSCEGRDPSSCDCKKLPPKTEEKWDVEYEQLSEDFRQANTLFWASLLAILAIDALLANQALAYADKAFFGTNLTVKPFVYQIGAILLLVFGLAITGLFLIFQIKLYSRNAEKTTRLKSYDKSHHFRRFTDEPRWRKMLNQGIGYSVLLFLVCVFFVALIIVIWNWQDFASMLKP